MYKSLRPLFMAIVLFVLFTLIAIAADNEWLTDWTLVAPLPQPFAYHRAVMHKNSIYVVGGEAPSWVTPGPPLVYANVEANGEIQGWVTPTPDPNPSVTLPIPFHRHAMVTAPWNNSVTTSVYVIGGWSNGNRYSNVWRADFSSASTNPTLGNWISMRSYPRKIIMHEAVYAQNRIYVLGGLDENDKVLDEIYFASIQNSTGTLDSWIKTNKSLPNLRYRFAAVYIKKDKPRIYILGGHDGVEAKDRVYSIEINDDGNLTNGWENQRSLPRVLYHHQAVYDGFRLFVIGGRDDDGSIDRVYSASVEANGELGEWREESLLPESLYRFAIAFDSDTTGERRSIYVLGGKHYDEFQAQVYRLKPYITRNYLPLVQR